jgi:hypothetical protein
MCQHQPQCPLAWEPDRLAARIVADRPEQGWSLLCNGVVLFEDDTEMVIASATDRRERENCAFVRSLLARKQPEFARALALALAERELARRDDYPPQRLADYLRDRTARLAKAGAALGHVA